MAKKDEQNDSTRRRRRQSQTADWGSAEPELLSELIQRITARDGAIRFGYTTDGGAYSVGIYGDGKPFTEFLPGTADVNDWLTGFIEDYG